MYLQLPVCRTRSRQGLGWDRVCEAMKAPVGLLSGSAVCDSRWRGVAPTSTPQQEHFGNSQELEK
ncbi:hypothetical protein DW816_05845 [Faecalibacterium prausnitzii]|nr:hypothetical protein DW816_05845 [Faecalibacterium prausnitzii]